MKTVQNSNDFDMTPAPLEGVTPSTKVNRRDLLKGTSAVVLASFVVPVMGRFAPADAANFTPNEWAYVTITRDTTANLDVFTIFTGQTEMGQGIMTGLAQILAQEICIPLSQVRVEHAVTSEYKDGDICQSNNSPITGYNSRLTGGSTAMLAWYDPLRQAGATIREKLRTAASTSFGCNLSDVVMANGIATDSKTGGSKPYSELVTLALAIPSVAASPLPTNTLVGKPVQRVDIPAKVNGTAVFGIDVNKYNTPRIAELSALGKELLYAAVQHAPTFTSSLPPTTTLTTPTGAVAAVNLTNAVAVVATDTWTAMKLADAMKPSWTNPATYTASNGLVYTTSQIDSTYIRNSSLSLLTAVNPTNLQKFDEVGFPDTVSGTTKIDVQYECPHMAHACMEPLNCTVYVDKVLKTCEIWAPAQSASACVDTAVAVLNAAGLISSAGATLSWTRSDVKVVTTFLGGGLGRKIEQDYISQAVRIAVSSKVIGKPVKLTWTRVQDFKNDKYRPAAYFRVQASTVPGTSSITSLVYRNVATSINRQNKYSSSNTNPPDSGALAGALAPKFQYTVANKRIEFVPNNVGVPLGYWRSVGESYNVFAVESAIDELARASGATDMIAFRRGLLSDQRSIAVLDAVKTLSNWNSAPPVGNARGVAFMTSFGSYIALVAEVSEVVNATTLVKTVKVNKIYCAIDCGIAINPDSVEAQVQGGIIHALGATLWGQATFTTGKSNLTNFNSYRVVKLKDMPTISVNVISKSDGKPGGVGETAVPVVAPAIANAYAALNGTRIRKLPFYPGSTMGGL